MKKCLFILLLPFLFTCRSKNDSTHSELRTDKSQEYACKEEILKRLEGIDFLDEIESDVIKQYECKKVGVKLTKSQKQLFFADIFPNTDELSAYLCSIKEIHNDIYGIVIFVEQLSSSSLFLFNVNCSLQVLDNIHFDDGDYFDVIDQDKETETGLFISKYFSFSNDTIIRLISITQEVKKELESDNILQKQIDSVAVTYKVNRKGEYSIIDKDSTRILTGNHIQ